MHTPGNIKGVAKDFDPKLFARRLKDTGFEAVCFFAKCTYGWSYYPTKVGCIHPGLERDLFGEGLRALHDNGLKVIAYYALEVAPPPIVNSHPEWHKIRLDGTVEQAGKDRTVCCIFGPYLEDYILPQVQEIAANYNVDGFFFDGLFSTYMLYPCHCASCRESFGQAFPVKDDDSNWHKYHEWLNLQMKKVCCRLIDEISAIRPETVAGFNHMSGCRAPFQPPSNIGYLTGDVLFNEENYFFWNYQLAAWGWRSIPCDCMNTRMLGFWRDWTSRPVETLKVEAALALSRGAQYFLGDLLLPDSLCLDKDILAMEQEVNDFIKEREKVCCNAKPIAELAILHHMGELANKTLDKSSAYGAFLAMMEEGWTVHVLYEDDLDEHLSNYKTLVLSDFTNISDKAITILNQYVLKGGSLIVCGTIPEHTAFLKILGVRLEGMHDFDTSYLTLPDGNIRNLLTQKVNALPPILVRGQAAKVKTDGACILCHLTAPGVVCQFGAIPPGKETEYVGLSINNYGNGQVVYSSLSLGKDFFDRGNVYTKYLLGAIARYLISKPLVEVEAETNIEIFTTQRGNEFIVHLLYRQVNGRPQWPRLSENTPSLHGIKLKIRLNSNPKSVYFVPGSEKLSWEKVGDQVVVKLPPLKMHGCCVIKL